MYSFKTLKSCFCKLSYLLHSDDRVNVLIALCDSNWPSHKSVLQNHTFGVLMKKMLVTCINKYFPNFVDRFWWLFCSLSPEKKKCWWSEFVIPKIETSVFIFYIWHQSTSSPPKKKLLMHGKCWLLMKFCPAASSTLSPQKTPIPKLKCIHQTAVVVITPTLEMSI